MDKFGIALKVLKSPTGRRLLNVGLKAGLKNPTVRNLVVKQAKKQVGKRLLGR